jgi:hypothetical protein
MPTTHTTSLPKFLLPLLSLSRTSTAEDILRAHKAAGESHLAFHWPRNLECFRDHMGKDLEDLLAGRIISVCGAEYVSKYQKVLTALDLLSQALPDETVSDIRDLALKRAFSQCLTVLFA